MNWSLNLIKKTSKNGKTLGRLRFLCIYSKDPAPTRSGGIGDSSSPAGILEAACSPPLEHGISDFDQPWIESLILLTQWKPGYLLLIHQKWQSLYQCWLLLLILLWNTFARSFGPSSQSPSELTLHIPAGISLMTVKIPFI